ncbi:unnamed protein product [Paramecium octaurelia]|uniref:Uncharacterized protein n=1 Tax=Paramecium octaurelia TaxID=43137 RepID=A0A8S1WGY8_PAROT|nr:unnamed protein product [Paramecium octaurelia]
MIQRRFKKAQLLYNKNVNLFIFFACNICSLPIDVLLDYGITKYLPAQNSFNGYWGWSVEIYDKANNQLHFIQYECIDYENQIIKKYFLFFDKEVGYIREEILIDYTQYESIWYFNGFFPNPSKQEVIIYLMEGIKQPYQKSIQIQFLIDIQKIEQIVGGDFIVPQNIPLQLFERDILSYFPGEIMYIEGCYISSSNVFINFFQSIHYNECQCQQSLINSMPDVTIEKQSQYEFVSQNINCQEFLLSGWVKISEIYSSDDEFEYQLIRLSGNFQHSQLIQKNLCAFQLFYRISTSQNQIIITTYSYTIPSVSIDFSSNPFLKSESLDVTFDIKLWHFILVKKLENSILISITFYNGLDKEEFNINLDVLQFNKMQFKLLYGNLLQSSSNYLKISIVGFQFFNCLDYYQPSISCHLTCKECDGPTKDDCLSCFEDSNRRYLADYKQCICEYGTVDENNKCVDYEDLNLQLNQGKPLKEECKYGFFEIEGDCQQCPSIINKNFITCLECVLNPKTWAQTLICQTTLYTNKEGNVSQQLEVEKQQFIFLGDDIQYCPDCKATATPSYDQIEKIDQFKDTCQSINENCYPCGSNCYECEILQTHFNCLTKLIGRPPLQKACQPPQYQNFEKVCVDCKIKNCLYCFNYFASDPTRTTLGFLEDYSFIDKKIQDGSYSLIDEEIVEGCAQCAEEYIFDFTIKECIFKKPSQQNCLKSYITFEKQEICTLSAIDDFNIALEIANCQSHLLNCKQCIKTPQSTLKCILCEDYYIVSTITGACSFCGYEQSKQCFEDNGLDPWKWFVQGFTIQFLPNKPIFYNYIKTRKTLITQCMPGYKTIKNSCQQFCDQMCLECNNIAFDFQCFKCKLDYYQDPIRNQYNGICFQCSSLCQVCESRQNEEINKINPYFVTTSQNIMYTYRCLQKVPLEQIQIDPNLQIAQYCYQNNCHNSLELYKDNSYCDVLQTYNQFNQLYYQYFNNIGLKEMTITLEIIESCFITTFNLTLQNDYRENIFSLQIARLKIQGKVSTFQPRKPFTLKFLNYDAILLTNIIFKIFSSLDLIFQNRGNPIDMKFVDISFFQTTDNASSLSIQEDSFLNFNMKNILIVGCSFENLVVFNIYCTDLGDTIIIDNFKLQNFNFINSTLFQFQNAQRTILFKNVIIDSCKFYNSSIFHFALTQEQFSNVIINDVQISNSLFQNTSFIYSNERTTFIINNLSIVKNKMMNSKFIIFNYEFNFKDILIKDNDLISYQFISQISSIIEKYDIQLKQIQIQRNVINNFQIFVTEQKQTKNIYQYIVKQPSF